MGKDMPLADLREPEEWAEYARLWPVGDLLSHMLGDNWTFGLLLDNGMCFASTTSTQCEPPQMAQCGSMSVCRPNGPHIGSSGTCRRICTIA